MATSKAIEKLTKENFKPTTPEGRLPVYAEQFNKLLEVLIELIPDKKKVKAEEIILDSPSATKPAKIKDKEGNDLLKAPTSPAPSVNPLEDNKVGFTLDGTTYPFVYGQIAQLTDSTGGTASTTINAAPASYNASNFNDIHASFVNRLNILLSQVTFLHKDVEELLTNQKNIIMALKDYGILS